MHQWISNDVIIPPFSTVVQARQYTVVDFMANMEYITNDKHSITFAESH